ncbi:MAG: hypothetical protein QXY87_11185 [Saccharolobus sp.]|uniref:hypothetical protein n=1 Tax=Saccharolobus TaxID=2100760 RepID=UPI001F0E7997|nr:hypothetical protein [Saccharolobus shibatae]MCH4816179.1 hypothetical protein [Saccharolobus shibatae]
MQAVNIDDILKEAERQLMICNACRYCEGYCDLWDAIERKRSFPPNDVFHLSNLCHDCRDCYYACQYTPPHPFSIDIPGILSKVRELSYRRFVYPKFMQRYVSSIYRFINYIYVILTIIIFAISISLTLFLHGFSLFRTYIPYQSLLPPYIFLAVEYLLYIYVVFMWYMEARSYWKSISNGIRFSLGEALKGVKDALIHKDFTGGGAGCSYPLEYFPDQGKNPKPSRFRLHAHATVLIGFIIDLISILFYPFKGTVTPAIFLIGSIMIAVGALSLLYKRKYDRLVHEDGGLAFTLMLSIAGVSGIIAIVLSLYHQPLYAVFFLLRASIIASLFIMAPYSKFVHLVFRLVSLMRDRFEEYNVKK